MLGGPGICKEGTLQTLLHGGIERQLGITEARFDIQLWREALQPFRVVDVEVNRKLKLRPDLKAPGLATWLSGIVGGNIKGLFQKPTGEAAAGDFRERLMCLDCHSVNLAPEGDATFTCRNCGRDYPVIDDVLRMLPQSLEFELYSKESGNAADNQGISVDC